MWVARHDAAITISLPLGGDIARQMPQEAKRFANIDKSWVKIMTTAAENPNVIKLCYGEEMLKNLLPHLLESLEICQKSLGGYLEAKRQVFPRFFFVSDSQLLEILGQGSDPQSIQPHLSSIFANVARVEFDRTQRSRIVSLSSAEGENVRMQQPCPADGNIEVWLNKVRWAAVFFFRLAWANILDTLNCVRQLVAAMRQAVCDIAASSIGGLDVFQNGDGPAINSFLGNLPAQVAVLGLQMFWTRVCEDSFERAKGERSAMPVCSGMVLNASCCCLECVS